MNRAMMISFRRTSVAILTAAAVAVSSTLPALSAERGRSISLLRDAEAELRKRMSEADAAARDIGQDLSGAPSHVDPDAGLAHASNADSQPPADDSRA